MIIWTFPIPAHGGEDSGAIGNNQYEKDYTLKISKYMYDRLRELGVPVTLTRDADVTLTPMERVNRILSAYGDDSNVIVISNHLNAGGLGCPCLGSRFKLGY